MPRTCTICRNNERQAIDSALVPGEALRTIADRWSVSKTALIRHGSIFPARSPRRTKPARSRTPTTYSTASRH
jgi:hypothetical protein